MYGPVEFFGRLFEMCKNRESECCHMRKRRRLGWIPLLKTENMRLRRRDVQRPEHLVLDYRIVNTIKQSTRGEINCLATVNCIVEDSRAFLGAKLFLRGQSNSQTISELIEGCRRKGIAIRSLKMDREFFAVDIMNMLDETGIAFTIPAIKTQGIKKVEFKQGVRDVVSRSRGRLIIILQKIGECLIGRRRGVCGDRSRWGVQDHCPRVGGSSLFTYLYNAWCLAKILRRHRATPRA